MKERGLTTEQVQRYFEDRVGLALRPDGKGEAMVLCPFHEDGNPSLSINVRRGVWHCFAGCGGGSLVEFEMRMHESEREDAIRSISALLDFPVPSLGAQSKRDVATYGYVDEEGSLLYQVVRYQPKGFRQRRPGVNGEWVWKLDGVRRVLYRLPEVVRAEEVYVVEGEKDSDRLAKLDLVATTNAGGASKWLPEFARYFHDKHVVILPDNDEPGRRHAEQVARSLHPVAASVRIIGLPELEKGQDVSDWLDAGHGKDDLLALKQITPPWEPATAGSSLLASIPNIWTLEVPPLEWTCEQFLAMGSITLLSGLAGVGKTWWGLALSKAILHSTDFLGRVTSRRKVIYCDRDNPICVIKGRLELLQFQESPDFHYWGLHCEPPPPMLEEPQQYVDLAQMDPHPVFIFDSLVRFHNAENENSASAMAPVMRQLRKIASAGAAVLVLHHRGKSEDNQYRGSSDIQAAVDLSLMMDGDAEQMRLETTKNRLEKEFFVAMKFDLGEGGFVATEDPSLANARQETQLVGRYIAQHPRCSQSEIVEALKGEFSSGRIRQILLRGKGKHWYVRKGAHNRYEYYPIAGEQEEVPCEL